jgi:signal transduction histidine kinase
VVELHGGTVEARNRAEGGLEVTLSLPLGRSTNQS